MIVICGVCPYFSSQLFIDFFVRDFSSKMFVFNFLYFVVYADLSQYYSTCDFNVLLIYIFDRKKSCVCVLLPNHFLFCISRTRPIVRVLLFV